MSVLIAVEIHTLIHEPLLVLIIGDIHVTISEVVVVVVAVVSDVPEVLLVMIVVGLVVELDRLICGVFTIVVESDGLIHVVLLTSVAGIHVFHRRSVDTIIDVDISVSIDESLVVSTVGGSLCW